LRIVPDDPDLWVAIASLRFTGGEQEQAIEASEKAVVLDPKNPRAPALRGLLIREQYGLAASLPWFEAALKNHPDDPPLLDAYASTLGDLGQYRAMLIVCRKLAEVDPKNPRPFLLQAVLAARAGQTNLARSILQRTGDLSRYARCHAVVGSSGVSGRELRQFGRRARTSGADTAGQPHRSPCACARSWGQRRLAPSRRPVRWRCRGGAWRRGHGRAGGQGVVAPWATGAGRPILAQALARKGPQVAVPLAADGELSVLASRYGDDPAHAANAVPYIRALMAAHHLDEAQDIADRLRDDNDGNAEVNLLAGDVRMMRVMLREPCSITPMPPRSVSTRRFWSAWMLPCAVPGARAMRMR
jgi:tetratricopeptide (TPR) repeat protein